MAHKCVLIDDNPVNRGFYHKNCQYPYFASLQPKISIWELVGRREGGTSLSWADFIAEMFMVTI